MTNRTAMNIESNKRIKQMFIDKGIERCESCGATSGLTFAHRKKRRHYNTVEELSDWNEVILLCLNEHIKIEQSPLLTAQMFARLRG
jgi:hypothetical protein